MRILRLLSAVVLAAGCSTSPCQHIANTIAAKTGSCPVTVSVNVNQCNLACSTISQTAIEEAATCLDAVPACSTSDETAYDTAAAACDGDLQNIAADCLQALTSSAVNQGSDGGNSGSSGYSCALTEDGLTICTTFAGSAYASTAATEQSDCAQHQGTFSESACPAGTGGSCVINQGKSTEVIEQFSGGDGGMPSYMQLCQSEMGVYTP